MNYLSNKEQKYRSKIIAENHLKKDGQRYLDQYVKRKSLTYKVLYMNFGELHSMLVSYNFSKLGNVMKNLGTSYAKAASAFRSLATNLSALNNNLRG